MRVSDHLTWLLRNLYVGQETTARIKHGRRDWFQIGKGVWQGCILSPCLFNFHAVYIMWSARLGESQAVIKIAGKISTTSEIPLRYSATTLMAESEEELKSLLIRIKRTMKKLAWNSTFKKTKIMASGLITSRQIEGEKLEAVTDFIFLGSKITGDGDCSHEI